MGIFSYLGSKAAGTNLNNVSENICDIKDACVKGTVDGLYTAGYGAQLGVRAYAGVQIFKYIAGNIAAAHVATNVASSISSIFSLGSIATVVKSGVSITTEAMKFLTSHPIAAFSAVVGFTVASDIENIKGFYTSGVDTVCDVKKALVSSAYLVANLSTGSAQLCAEIARDGLDLIGVNNLAEFASLNPMHALLGMDVPHFDFAA